MEAHEILDSIYSYYRNVLCAGLREALAEEITTRAHLTAAIDIQLEHACRVANEAALKAFHKALEPNDFTTSRDFTEI